MVARGWNVIWAAGLLLAGCASTPPATKQINLVVNNSSDQKQADADLQEVLRGIKMIRDGKVLAAISGPLDSVVNRYEAKYAHSNEIHFSARNGTDALLYLMLPTTQKSTKSAVVLGPAWAMAYWGRGFAYNEMARYNDALVELDKALALAPYDAQYNIEIGYTCQQMHQWNESLEHFKTAEGFVSITVPDAEVKMMTCHALRGEGFDLTELHRYAESRSVYRSCLKLIPGEPKSLGELKYIDQVEARGKAS